MNIKFTSRNTKLAEPLKIFAIKRLKAIEKISGDIIEAELMVNEERIGFRVEIILKTKLNSYHIEDNNPILKQALRKTLNTLKSQAKKNKEKIKIKKKRTKKRGIVKETISQNINETLENNTANKIIVSNNFSRKPLSIEEAIFFLKESQENAFMFINTETNKMSVVFFTRNNNISIIESKI